MNKFNGVFTALITPFLPNDDIDEKVLENLINRQVEQKINGLVLAGSTGEAATLEISERAKLVKIAKNLVKDQTILAGAGHNSTKMALLMQKAMEDAGADATLHVTPYYNKPTEEGLLKHFSLIAKNAQIPIILYNVPSRTGVDMSVDLIVKLLKEEENIIGIKESNPNLERFTLLVSKIREVRPNASIFTGEDGLFLPSLSIGADGIISIATNLIIKDFLNIYSFMKNGDIKKAQEVLYSVSEFCRLLFFTTNPIPIKTILSRLGFIKNNYRLPLCPLSSVEENKLWEQYEQIKHLLNW